MRMTLGESTKTKLYEKIERDLVALIGTDGRMPWETGLTSMIALLKSELPYVSWVGLYRETPRGSGTLWVGPYQGKIACVEIPPGQGVCGASLLRRDTLIVPNVDEFPGHIACDSLSRSEIVLPVWRRGELIGVLDLDSHELAAFDRTDAVFLEKMIQLLGDHCG